MKKIKILFIVLFAFSFLKPNYAQNTFRDEQTMQTVIGVGDAIGNALNRRAIERNRQRSREQLEQWRRQERWCDVECHYINPNTGRLQAVPNINWCLSDCRRREMDERAVQNANQQQMQREAELANQTQDVGVVINGVRWATRNVGAPGTFAPRPESAGMFYQWNRNVGWSSTNPMINSNSGTVWNSYNSTGNTWERANDPCPQGWRVPTRKEIQTLGNVNQWTTLNGVNGRTFTDRNTGNTVFFPAVGWRDNTNGALNTVSAGAHYWSNTLSDTAVGFPLFFFSTDVDAGFNAGYRTTGFSVRCVAE